MAQLIKVEGFEAFKAKLSELTAGGGDVFVMFSGSKDASGVSWCPDCVTAEPIVSVGHSPPLLPLALHFIMFLFDRSAWKRLLGTPSISMLAWVIEPSGRTRIISSELRRKLN